MTDRKRLAIIGFIVAFIASSIIMTFVMFALMNELNADIGEVLIGVLEITLASTVFGGIGAVAGSLWASISHKD